MELVLALTALASAAGTAERPAAMALLPRVVGVARLGPANALLHTVQDLGVVVGPGDRGRAPGRGAERGRVPRQRAHLRRVGGARSRRCAAASSPPARREDESAGFHFLQGLRTARATPFVVPLLIVIGMAELTYGAQTVQLVVYAAQRLDLGAAGYGYLLAAGGVGGVLSALGHAAARDEHARLGRRGRHRCPLLRHAARLCGGRRARLRAGGDADRRRGLRGLRGGRRDDARPPGSGRVPGTPDGRRRGRGGRGDGGRRAPRSGPARLDVAPRQPLDPRAGRAC